MVLATLLNRTVDSSAVRHIWKNFEKSSVSFAWALDIIASTLERGDDPEAKGASGKTVPHTAAENRNSNVVGCLPNRADIEAKGDGERSVLCFVADMRTKRLSEFYRATEDEETQLLLRGDPPVASQLIIARDRKYVAHYEFDMKLRKAGAVFLYGFLLTLVSRTGEIHSVLHLTFLTRHFMTTSGH